MAFIPAPESWHPAFMMPASAPPPPDEPALREAALTHLARFATTEQGLRDVLTRRLRRWAVRAERADLDAETIASAVAACMDLIPGIVMDMVRIGALDDTTFAMSRARGMTRAGRSRRAVAVHLAQRGVGQDDTTAALDAALGERSDTTAHDHELGAALVLARKRRLGPFSRPFLPSDPDDPDAEEPPHSRAHAEMQTHTKALAVFARNGFERSVAEAALCMEPEEAEARIIALRSS